MNNNVQDTNWSCLTSSLRQLFRGMYQKILKRLNEEASDWIEADEELLFILKDSFGENNLTSDHEPEEILVAKASVVRGFYNQFNDSSPAQYAWAVRKVLEKIFEDQLLQKQNPCQCQYFLKGQNLCMLNPKETTLFGGGYWVRCCDICDDPEYVCPDFTSK